MAKKKNDRLSVGGVLSTILKQRSQQRSMKKRREKLEARRATRNGAPAVAPEPKPEKLKDTRTPEQIRASVDESRARLVATVERVKYDLDVPARAKDVRDDVRRRLPSSIKGEPAASITAASLLAAGLALIAGVSALAGRRER
ncbi:DUF3618 domain-containing protein [Marisediminicola senii]|uniref:DUF3618 domain-containing protein n=1 Tax=Marisediminicola senii TaxID=2711233 RepID=UPI0013EA8D8F|nr:DUF3618 domain-containing protein [Marisediminicola senii]